MGVPRVFRATPPGNAAAIGACLPPCAFALSRRNSTISVGAFTILAGAIALYGCAITFAPGLFACTPHFTHRTPSPASGRNSFLARTSRAP